MFSVRRRKLYTRPFFCGKRTASLPATNELRIFRTVFKALIVVSRLFLERVRNLFEVFRQDYEGNTIRIEDPGSEP